MNQSELMYRVDYKRHRDKHWNTALYPTRSHASKYVMVFSEEGYEVSDIQPVNVTSMDPAKLLPKVGFVELRFIGRKIT